MLTFLDRYLTDFKQRHKRQCVPQAGMT